jgi:hypothetical protein
MVRRGNVGEVTHDISRYFALAFVIMILGLIYFENWSEKDANKMSIFYILILTW